MNDPLATYLHDHLAGSNFAVELLKTLRDQHTGEPLGDFAAATLAEVQEDREVLQGIIDRVGRSGVDLKETVAWLAEKVSQLKLRRDNAGLLGTFQALETLALGIMGKASLWQALAVIGRADERVSGLDYQELAAKAMAQHARVEQQRLQIAAVALMPSASR